MHVPHTGLSSYVSYTTTAGSVDVSSVRYIPPMQNWVHEFSLWRAFCVWYFAQILKDYWLYGNRWMLAKIAFVL